MTLRGTPGRPQGIAKIDLWVAFAVPRRILGSFLKPWDHFSRSWIFFGRPWVAQKWHICHKLHKLTFYGRFWTSKLTFYGRFSKKTLKSCSENDWSKKKHLNSPVKCKYWPFKFWKICERSLYQNIQRQQFLRLPPPGLILTLLCNYFSRYALPLSMAEGQSIFLLLASLKNNNSSGLSERLRGFSSWSRLLQKSSNHLTFYSGFIMAEGLKADSSWFLHHSTAMIQQN